MCAYISSPERLIFSVWRPTPKIQEFRSLCMCCLKYEALDLLCIIFHDKLESFFSHTGLLILLFPGFFPNKRRATFYCSCICTLYRYKMVSLCFIKSRDNSGVTKTMDPVKQLQNYISCPIPKRPCSHTSENRCLQA